MTTVSIRARPATMDDLRDGHILLLPIIDEEYGQSHRAVTIIEKNLPNYTWYFYRVSELHKYEPVPQFFPEDCYVPAP